MVNSDRTKSTLAWAPVPKVDVNNLYQKEWRFTYKNIPNFGSAAIKIVMVEDSMDSDSSSLTQTAINNTATINFNCYTRAPNETQ